MTAECRRKVWYAECCGPARTDQAKLNSKGGNKVGYDEANM